MVGTRAERAGVVAAGAIILLSGLVGASPSTASGPSALHVIVVSVDGLRPDAVTQLGPGQLPNFYRFRTAGAFTDNARTDFALTVTLPNNAAMLTGRPTAGDNGHGLTLNNDTGGVIHGLNPAVPYVASAFDVVHDRGESTALYVTKSKFDLLNRSWDGAHGAPDVVGVDDGRDKIDTYVYDADGDVLVDRFITDMATNPYSYSLVHLRAPDAAGHANGWMSNPYLDSVRSVDASIGDLIQLVEGQSLLTGNTVIIVTSDHGGSGTNHAVPTSADHYTVPVYAWGAGVAAGDLYDLNAASRLDPGSGRPGPAASPAPIRNGDVANLALSVLGFPSVPGSVLNADQDLAIQRQTVTTELSVFDPLTGEWQFLTPDGAPDNLYFGVPGDIPLLGDWDCNGSATPGVYRRSTGKAYLSNIKRTGIAEVDFYFGGPGDVPVAGDWDGDGCDTLAVYRNGEVFITNALATGVAEFSFRFGTAGDVPFAGDFNGSGADSIAVYRAGEAKVSLRNSLSSGPAELEFFYGAPFDQIIAADWDGDGNDTVGVYRAREGRFYLSNENRVQEADIVLELGEAGWSAAVASSAQ